MQDMNRLHLAFCLVLLASAQRLAHAEVRTVTATVFNGPGCDVLNQVNQASFPVGTECATLGLSSGQELVFVGFLCDDSGLPFGDIGISPLPGFSCPFGDVTERLPPPDSPQDVTWGVPYCAISGQTSSYSFGCSRVAEPGDAPIPVATPNSPPTSTPIADPSEPTQPTQPSVATPSQPTTVIPSQPSEPQEDTPNPTNDSPHGHLPSPYTFVLAVIFALVAAFVF